jgi:hypothetical protein
MAFTDFTLAALETQFGVKNQVASLFNHIDPVEASNFLIGILNAVKELPTRSEKAKSESFVFPILLELRNRNNNYFTIYSGDTFNGDDAQGLKGECDFILAKDTKSFDINTPIIQIVEAKKNDIDLGVPQCAAQLVGAKLFNEKRGVRIDVIYGTVTTGEDWLFMKLEKHLTIDTRKYYLRELSELLGALQNIINYYKAYLK